MSLREICFAKFSELALLYKIKVYLIVLLAVLT